MKVLRPELPIVSDFDAEFDSRGILVSIPTTASLNLTKSNTDLLIEYFAKATIDDDFEPIINTEADAHTPSNLTKSKVWAGYLVVNGVNYSSGFDQESYPDIVPKGMIYSYLMYDASYVDVIWEDNIAYKVRITVKRNGEVIVLEKEFTED